jgi:hypothetical protein
MPFPSREEIISHSIARSKKEIVRCSQMREEHVLHAFVISGRIYGVIGKDVDCVDD